jgi:hypothetical protein
LDTILGGCKDVPQADQVLANAVALQQVRPIAAAHRTGYRRFDISEINFIYRNFSRRDVRRARGESA